VSGSSISEYLENREFFRTDALSLTDTESNFYSLLPTLSYFIKDFIVTDLVMSCLMLSFP